MTWQSTKPPISPTITKKQLAQHWGIETEVPKKKHNERLSHINSSKGNHRCNLVLHMHPTTFLGDGSFGPLSRCPEVKYSQPSQYPTNVVLIRKGNRPITLHSCRWRFNSVTMACQGPQIHNDLQNAILIHSYDLIMLPVTHLIMYFFSIMEM